MSVKFAKYEALEDSCLTKDGHTMFIQDIVNDLNRKSFLEGQTNARGETIVSQQTEIAELKLLLEVADSRASAMVTRSSELKAMVNALREHTARYMYRVEASGREGTRSIEDLLAKTPAQCLANVKADAIREAIFNSYQVDVDGDTYVGKEDLEVSIEQIINPFVPKESLPGSKGGK